MYKLGNKFSKPEGESFAEELRMRNKRLGIMEGKK